MSERNRLEQLLRNGSITRREFLARSTALGIAGGVAPALLSEAAHAETPKKGGRLRMGVTDANISDSLDPAPSVTIMQANNHVRECSAGLNIFGRSDRLEVGSVTLDTPL